MAACRCTNAACPGAAAAACCFHARSAHRRCASLPPPPPPPPPPPCSPPPAAHTPLGQPAGQQVLLQVRGDLHAGGLLAVDVHKPQGHPQRRHQRF